MNTKLWTWSEQQEIRPIDENNAHLFEQIQSEVQNHDLRKLLGFEFFNELFKNIADYTLLLSGGEYTYLNGTYNFNGLKYVCAYLFYARYIRESRVNDTFTGFVTHTADGMQPLSSNEIMNLENRYKEIATTEWEACMHYLKSTEEPPTATTGVKQNINWFI